MSKGEQAGYYFADLNELADFDAWEGYEFWSAQLEAQMESLAGLGPEFADPARMAGKESHSDVLPF